MEEESLRFWIIPVISIVIVVVFFAFSMDYRYNTVFPSAELERQELEIMSCPEILAKDATKNYWSSENAKIGNDKAIVCAPPKEASQSSGLNPYVAYCTPGGFAPDKKIENATHSFNHDTCTWE